MAFKFRLQAVQKVHQYQRDEEKQSLAQLLQKQSEILKDITRQQNELARIKGERFQLLRSGNLQMGQLQHYSRFEARLEKKLHELLEQQNQLLFQVEAQRNALIKSEQEVKKFEKLEEKQREIYRKAHSET